MAFPLYFDDDSYVKAVVAGLRLLSVECHIPVEEFISGHPDSEHLQHSTAHGWAIITRNERDFMRLHAAYLAAGDHHSGIIIVRQTLRLDVGEQIRRLGRMQEHLDAESMKDWVEYLSRW